MGDFETVVAANRPVPFHISAHAHNYARMLTTTRACSGLAKRTGLSAAITRLKSLPFLNHLLGEPSAPVNNPLPSWQTYPCVQDAYHCVNPYGDCMPANWECDGVRDCYNGQDEENCGTANLVL